MVEGMYCIINLKSRVSVVVYIYKLPCTWIMNENIYFCASLKGIILYVKHLRMRIEIRERGIYYFIVEYYIFLTYFQWFDIYIWISLIHVWITLKFSLGSHIYWFVSFVHWNSNCGFDWKWGKSNLLERWRDPWSQKM